MRRSCGREHSVVLTEERLFLVVEVGESVDCLAVVARTLDPVVPFKDVPGDDASTPVTLRRDDAHLQ